MRISVCIPTYSMANSGFFFKRALESLWMQTFQDFEIVVSDNSTDNTIRNICEFYKTGIEYEWNPRKGITRNTNHTIKRAKGELIKILNQDDYLLHDKVLEQTADLKEGWLVMGSDNNFDPYYTPDIITGNNKLGSPSALTIKNDNPLLFDEKLTWVFDCVYYKQLYERYGEPTIIAGKHIGIGIHDGQMTNLLSAEVKRKEVEYVMKKYG